MWAETEGESIPYYIIYRGWMGLMGRDGANGLMGRGATGIAEPDFLPGWGKSFSGQGKKNSQIGNGRDVLKDEWSYASSIAPFVQKGILIKE